MRTGNLAHPIVLRLVTLLVIVCCTHAAHAGSLQDVQFPKPITSAQYEKALKDAALPVEERAAFDAAFDKKKGKSK